LEVLYEDNPHYLPINKKVGDIGFRETRQGTKSLMDFVKDYVKEKYQKPGAAFLGVIHRIDRPCQWSCFICTHKQGIGADELNCCSVKKKFKKHIGQLSKNKPKDEAGSLIHYLKKDEAKNKSKAFEKEVAGSLRSWLDYKIIVKSDNYFFTRNQSSYRKASPDSVLSLLQSGCPIKGDVKIWALTERMMMVLFTSMREKFLSSHPIKKEEVSITAPGT